MSESDLEARLAAVERALTDGDTDLATLDSAEFAADVERLEERLATVEQRLDDFDAAVQAVRGYVGNVRAVNRDVERRASAALAKAETLESAVHDERAAETNGGPERADSTAGRTAGTQTDGARTAPGAHAEGDQGRSARQHDGDPDRADGERADGPRRSGAGPDPARAGREPVPEADAGRPKADADHPEHGERQNTDRERVRPDADSQDVLGRSDLDVERLREENGEDDSESTAQFIERVRDVL